MTLARVQKSMKAHANTVKGIERYLDKKGVKYLDYFSFNEEDDDNFDYQAEYETLYEKVVIEKIFKHFNIDPRNNTDLSFNYFENDRDGRGWCGVFYEPEELSFSVDKVMNNDFSGLEQLWQYSKDKA